MIPKERQTTLPEYASNQVGLTPAAYSILMDTKIHLIKTYKKHFTFSDAIIDMDRIIKGGDNIKFTKDEIKQIKQKLQNE